MSANFISLNVARSLIAVCRTYKSIDPKITYEADQAKLAGFGFLRQLPDELLAEVTHGRENVGKDEVVEALLTLSDEELAGMLEVNGHLQAAGMALEVFAGVVTKLLNSFGANDSLALYNENLALRSA